LYDNDDISVIDFVVEFTPNYMPLYLLKFTSRGQIDVYVINSCKVQ